MSERSGQPQPLAQLDPAGEPPAALVSLVENHPHHAALLWGAGLRCLVVSRPLRRYFVEEHGCDPAQGGGLLEAALRDVARRVVHGGVGEIHGVRLLGQVVEGVQLCPAGLGGAVVLLPALPGGIGDKRGPRGTATLRGILDTLPLPLVVAFGARGEERLLNAAAKQMLGATERDELSGEPLAMVEARWGKRRGDGSPLPEETYPLRRALRERETVLGVEISFAPYSSDTPLSGHEEERRVYLESAAPIIGPGGPGGPGAEGELLGAVAVYQEITEHKRADRQKDRFLAVAAHELRTPLTVLRTQTQLISRWLDELPAEQVRQVAEGIDQQTERLSQLVDDLLDVGRLATGAVDLRPQPLELMQLVRDVVARLRTTSSQHPFEVSTSGEVWVLGDALRVEQIVGNLLGHAQRVTPPGGRIGVRVYGAPDATYGLLAVEDQGPPVQPEERERIFERFHRSERARRGDQGLGLGLWISRKLVELMGGRIWVEGLPGGAAFVFQLPAPPKGAR